MREVGKKYTQTVTVRRHAADVSVTSGIGSGPGGAGPVGVVVRISHRLGIQTDAVITACTLFLLLRRLSAEETLSTRLTQFVV